MTDKRLKDLEGWTQTRFSTPSIWSWRKGYSVFISPDGNRVAQVDMSDEEVSLIFNRETKKMEYLHPTTIIGMKAAGVTKEWLEGILAKSGV
jgi:hypothetical protein